MYRESVFGGKGGYFLIILCQRQAGRILKIACGQNGKELKVKFPIDGGDIKKNFEIQYKISKYVKPVYIKIFKA